MKNLFTILFIFVIANFVYSQQPQGLQAQENIKELGAGGTTSTVLTFNNLYKGIHGNPFLYSKWYPGKIITSRGTTFEDIEMKLDIYKDLLRIKRSTGDSLIVNSNNVKRFTLHNTDLNRKHEFIYLINIVQEDPKSEIGFFEILYEGENVMFLVKKEKILNEARTEGAYKSGSMYDEFLNISDRWYVLKNEYKLRRVKSRKKDFIELAPEHGNEIKNYINENDLKLKETNDIIALMKYIDNLL